MEANGLPLTWNGESGIAWSRDLAGYGQSAPVIWNENVYITYCAGDMKEQLHVLALALNSGEKKWEQTFANSTPEENTNYVSKAAPTPVADEDGIIVFFEGGNLVALDHHGESRWERDLVQDYGSISARHGLASSLEQDQDQVFVWVERSEQPYVLAVAKSDGTTTWKVDGVGKTAWSSPRLVPVKESRHLVLSAMGKIVGLEPSTGRRLWQFEDVANNTTPTPIPLGGGRFLLGATEGRGAQPAAPIKSNGVIQISEDDDGNYAAEYIWRAEKATSSFGSPIAGGGNAYFVNRAGVIYCHDLETGTQRYAQRSPGSVWATPLHVGNRVYFFGRDGVTTVIGSGNEFEILARNPLWETEAGKGEKEAANQARTGGGFGGPVLYAAAMSGNKFILRRGDRVYCLSEQAN